ncbi:MAG: cardiolipin synthase [Lachnospiraceae bacterium]|nr:cardiolipin synthase [Lachnospiraceae bacterium]
MEERVVSLYPKKKKGILRLLFSRTMFMVLAVVLQVALYVLILMAFANFAAWFTAAMYIASFILIIYLINSRMDSTAKMTWIFFMGIFPLGACLFYFFTQTSLGHRKLKEGVEKQVNATRTLLPQDQEVLKELEHTGADDLCRYMNRSGCFPIYKNCEVTYFPLGEDKFKAMLEELEKAEKFIFMEYFIVGEGYMWGRILDVLERKARAGVTVRVMYDGMCEISLLPHDYPKRMQTLGIECRSYAPLQPFVSTHYNYRDHRKILVIDGKVAFNGGVNLADEYINRIDRFGHWKDTAVCIKGEAAQSFTLMFLQMWNVTDSDLKYEDYLPATEPLPVKAAGYVMPYGDEPLDEDKVGEMVYMDILNRSRSYVHIMTPYLILDGELLCALKFAAERGVDVKIILPGIPDKTVAYALAKTHYASLLDSGVQIYEYTPGFVHAKVFVCDDERAVVGTINLDYRSLYHHFECATYMYKTDCIADIETDFRDTLSKCMKVTRETMKKDKLKYKIIGPFAKILAPLM